MIEGGLRPGELTMLKGGPPRTVNVYFNLPEEYVINLGFQKTFTFPKLFYIVSPHGTLQPKSSILLSANLHELSSNTFYVENDLVQHLTSKLENVGEPMPATDDELLRIIQSPRVNFDWW